MSPAETLPVPAGSARLVTVAQALHWFDLARFFSEVRRVLAPDGVLAVISYASFPKYCSVLCTGIGTF